MTKTNVMRLLGAAGIAYRTAEYEYDEANLSGLHAAEQVGMDAEQVFFKEPTIPPEVAEYEEPVDLAELVGDMDLAKLDQIFKSIMKNRWTRLTRCVRSLVRSRRKKFHFRIRCCMWRTSAKHTEISASATFWKRRRARWK